MIGKPGDYALGSIQSRIAARAILDRIRVAQEENAIIVTVEHIGYDGRVPLPPLRRIVSEGGVTEIIHVSATGHEACGLSDWLTRISRIGKDASRTHTGQ